MPDRVLGDKSGIATAYIGTTEVTEDKKPDLLNRFLALISDHKLTLIQLLIAAFFGAFFSEFFSWMTTPNTPPTATLTVQSESEFAPTTIRATVNADDNETSELKFTWFLNESQKNSKDNVTSFNVKIPGEYSIKVLVEDDDKGVVERTRTIVLKEHPGPSIHVTGSNKATGYAPLSVTLDASFSYSPTGSEVSFEWRSEGNLLSTSPKQTFSMMTPQAKTVVLRVTSDGITNEREFILKALPQPLTFGTTILNRDTTIGESNRDLILNGSIITNGFNLHLMGATIISNHSTIRAHYTRAPHTPPNSANGYQGASGQSPGEDGKNGGNGVDGRPGENGDNAGHIIINANALKGKLYIHNAGMNGGRGGAAGNGGPGGSGARNTMNNDANLDSVSTICGKGGDGGHNGIGGKGGNGGNGGDVEINVQRLTAYLDINTAGGKAGLQGSHGSPGKGGSSGKVVVRGYPYRVLSPLRPAGITPQQMTEARPGINGKPSLITIKVQGQIIYQSDNGSYIHVPD